MLEGDVPDDVQAILRAALLLCGYQEEQLRTWEDIKGWLLQREAYMHTQLALIDTHARTSHMLLITPMEHHHSDRHTLSPSTFCLRSITGLHPPPISATIAGLNHFC